MYEQFLNAFKNGFKLCLNGFISLLSGLLMFNGSKMVIPFEHHFIILKHNTFNRFLNGITIHLVF